MPTESKKQAVAKLQEKMSRMTSAVLVDFSKLDMPAQQSIRRKLREKSVDFVVIKNSLLKISAESAGINFIAEDVLKGQTGIALDYGDDVVMLPKMVASISKELDQFKVKGGLLKDQYLNAADLEKLAKIPGKKELQGQVVGLLVASPRNLLSVLQGNLTNVVRLLSAYREKKS